MAYRGLGNQGLGAASDLAQVLDTLMRLDTQETQSEERIAMQTIREDMQNKRQADRDERLFKQSIDLKNREMKSTYDVDDLKEDDVGLLFPKEGVITRPEKSKLETGLQKIVGGDVDFDDPSYSSLMGAINTGQTWYENIEWDKDPSKGVLSYHDIPEVMGRLEIEKPDKVDSKQWDAAVRSGLRANKGILQTQAEYQKYLLDKAKTGVYQATANANLSESQRESFALDQDYIKKDFFEPIYARVYGANEYGVEVYKDFDARREAIVQEVKSEYGTKSPQRLRQVENAINEMFGIEWSGRHNTRDFLTAFKKWDRTGRSGERSIAEDIYASFNLQDRYHGLHKLTSEYQDVQGQMEDKKLIKHHFRDDVNQVMPHDDWNDKLPAATFFLDHLVQDGSIVLEKRGGNFVIRYKDFNKLSATLLRMAKGPEAQRRDAQQMTGMQKKQDHPFGRLIVEKF